MIKTIDILVGIAASGKSTYADATLREYPNGKLHNADSIRERIFGDAKCQDEPMRVFGILFDEYTQHLKDDVTDYIIIDNTSLTPKMRKRYIDLAQTICPMFGHEFEVRMVFFPVDVDRSIKLNAKRERTIPEDVIRQQAQRYTQASEFEKENCTILTVKYGI